MLSPSYLRNLVIRHLTYRADFREIIPKIYKAADVANIDFCLFEKCITLL
jgi:hypothetical protein